VVGWGGVGGGGGGGAGGGGGGGGGVGWFMDVRVWGLSGSLWGNIFLRFCVGALGCFSWCFENYWVL
jgi:hypothetical protein